MRESALKYLVCPACQHDLAVRSVERRCGDRLESAQLGCTACHAEYPVIRFVPRFVPISNYASGFGLQWNIHARTQYDSYSGVRQSELRFFDETRWPRDLTGEVILEVGSGSGRFTEQAASTGAFVVSMDYSYAVEANYQSNGHKENVLIVQGDIYAMPFRRASFDRVFCFGVLQHTPDVPKAFFALPPMLKPGGHLVADVYKRSLTRPLLVTKYYVRPFTRNMDPERLYKLCTRWIDLMWPLSRAIRKIPRVGHIVNWTLMVADYSPTGLKDKILREWAYLDTFDMLAPRYDSPQSLPTVRRWFRRAGLTEVDVREGWGGVYGRARRPLAGAAR